MSSGQDSDADLRTALDALQKQLAQLRADHTGLGQELGEANKLLALEKAAGEALQARLAGATRDLLTTRYIQAWFHGR